MIPVDLRDKAWVKDFTRAEKPIEALAKAYEGALGMANKKVEPVIPATADEYKMPTIEWGEDKQAAEIGEAITKSRSEDFTKGILGLFHEAKLTQEQIDSLWVGYEKLNVNSIKKAMADNEAAAAQADVAFKEKFDKRFGAEARVIRERVSADLVKHVPQDLATSIDSLSDEQLMAVAAFADSMYKKYGREDQSFGRRDNTIAGDAKSLEARRLELMVEREKLLNEAGGIRSERYIQIETEMDAIRKDLAIAYRK